MVEASGTVEVKMTHTIQKQKKLLEVTLLHTVRSNEMLLPVPALFAGRVNTLLFLCSSHVRCGVVHSFAGPIVRSRSTCRQNVMYVTATLQ